MLNEILKYFEFNNSDNATCFVFMIILLIVIVLYYSDKSEFDEFLSYVGIDKMFYWKYKDQPKIICKYVERGLLGRYHLLLMANINILNKVLANCLRIDKRTEKIKKSIKNSKEILSYCKNFYNIEKPFLILCFLPRGTSRELKNKYKEIKNKNNEFKKFLKLYFLKKDFIEL